jgi:hypothetical protein
MQKISITPYASTHSVRAAASAASVMRVLERGCVWDRDLPSLLSTLFESAKLVLLRVRKLAAKLKNCEKRSVMVPTRPRSGEQQERGHERLARA